ncbi:MAG: hypothetical protein IPK60_02250 [Sandaracinaceae bacterium]|nr:hypothetical protein [Sandaracinaceae bacterium]
MQRTRVADEIKALVALVRDGQKTRDDALREVDPQKLLSTLRPSLPSAEVLAARGHPLLARGLSASAGVGSGEIAFHASRVLELAAARKDVVLVRPETSAEDVHALRVSRAVLTVTGGLTSHAAVMARGVGKPCVVGCDALRIDEHKATLEITDPDTRVMVRALKEGDVITVDGNSGNVYQGAVPPVPAAQLEELQSVLEWADERRTLAVFGNASNAQDAQDAMQAGAAGIGLCRLEQMLTAPTAADLVRVVFFANDEAAKTLALGELKTFIVSELTAIYAVAKDTTVRLFDAPAMDFAPTNEHETHALAKRLGVSPQTMVAFIQDQRERWPAFGARGVRMCVTQPDFARMQIDSVQSAATLAGTTARILVPFVSMAEELAHIRSLWAKTPSLAQCSRRRGRA